MSAATVTAPAYEVTIAEAQAVFAAARVAERPEGAEREIGEAVWDLAIALKDYHNLVNGIVPPWCPGITPRPEGRAKVLRIAADRAWEAASDVTAVMGEYGVNGGEK